MLSPRDPELTAYIVILREALRGLVEALRCQEAAPAVLVRAGVFSVEPETQRAEEVLRMETGRHAQAELALESALVDAGYTLADWCHHALYGTARSPRGGVPTRDEVAETLAEIDRVTRASWALDALLSVPRQGHSE